MDKNKLVDILLVLVLIAGLCTTVLDFEIDKKTNIIEENLQYALDENIVASRYFEKIKAEAIELVDAHLSYVHESLKGNYAESKNLEQDLEEKNEEFKYNSINVSQEFKKCISNATKLKEEIIESRDDREIIRSWRQLFDLLEFIFLFSAIICTALKKDDVSDSLAVLKSENKDMKEYIKRLDDILIECNEDAWNNKGRILLSQGKYDEAVQAYEKALEINPYNADAWTSKGSVLKLLGRTKEANEAFSRAKELGLPSDPSSI
jgi:tetratricopeptide (TPR) repeat protein